MAVEGKLVSVFRLSRFHFLVPVRLCPAADDPGSYGQHNYGDENGHCDDALKQTKNTKTDCTICNVLGLVVCKTGLELKSTCLHSPRHTVFITM